MRSHLPLTTSAGYATSVRPFVIVRQIFGLVGTTTVDDYEVIPVPQTSAGAVVAETPSGNGALAELRRLSGLSWEQLSRVLGVSRRALHFWASGKPMASSNEEHLQRVLAVVRSIDRGSAAANRTALLEARDDELIAADLLAAREYERVISLASRVSAEARMARTPPRPETLVGAMHDTVHRDAGPSRPARSTKVDRRK